MRALWILAILGCRSGEASSGLPWKQPFALAQGGEYTLPVDSRAILLFFIRPDCPFSNSYLSELKRLVGEYRPRGISPVLVYAEADLEPWKAECHTFEFDVGCEAILDPKLVLARAVGATVTPEAALVSADGEILYRGRIDDRYDDLGKRRPQATRRDLQDALEAVLEGRPIPGRTTRSIGCPILFHQESTRMKEPLVSLPEAR
jgi:hypothetical protein